MKLWQLLDALKGVDQSAEVSIVLAGEFGPRTKEFSVSTSPGSLDFDLVLQPEDFPLRLAAEIEDQMDDLEVQADNAEQALNQLKDAAEEVIRATNAIEIADAIKELDRTLNKL